MTGICGLQTVCCVWRRACQRASIGHSEMKSLKRSKAWPWRGWYGHLSCRVKVKGQMSFGDGDPELADAVPCYEWKDKCGWGWGGGRWREEMSQGRRATVWEGCWGEGRIDRTWPRAWPRTWLLLEGTADAVYAKKGTSNLLLECIAEYKIR